MPWFKCNVGDYRATDPKALLQPGIVAVSPANLPAIRQAAAGAGRVVLCHGKLNKALGPAAANIRGGVAIRRHRPLVFWHQCRRLPQASALLRGDTQLIPFGN